MAKTTQAPTSKVDEKKLISDVPAWVLMAKVDTDFAMWQQGQIGLEDEDEDDLLQFPEYDSTIKALELLEKAGIKFNQKKGTWSS
jgi:hypothetical protein